MRSKKFKVSKESKETIPKVSLKPQIEKRRKKDGRINKYFTHIKDMFKGTQNNKEERPSSQLKDNQNQKVLDDSITNLFNLVGSHRDGFESAYKAGFARGISEVYRCLEANNPETLGLRKQLIRNLSKSVPKKFSRIVLQQDSGALETEEEQERKPRQKPTVQRSISFSDVSFDDTTKELEIYDLNAKQSRCYFQQNKSNFVHDVTAFGTPIMSSTLISTSGFVGSPLTSSTPTLTRKLVFSKSNLFAEDTIMEGPAEKAERRDFFGDFSDSKYLAFSEKTLTRLTLRDSGNGTDCR